jgi:hypothetical protein
MIKFFLPVVIIKCVNNEFSETNGSKFGEYDSGDGKFAITQGEIELLLCRHQYLIL